MLELVKPFVAVGDKTLLSLDGLTARPGQLTAILGPNGAGKTTALKLLSGEAEASEGEALLDGQSVRDMGAAALARRRAVVTQSSSLSFDFLVWEVVALGRQPHVENSSAAIDEAIIIRALEMVDAVQFAGRRYLTLSGGERQRVQFARALAQVLEPADITAPKYLLLDEPTSALDLKYQIDCLELARDFARDGNGVVVILHDLNLARAYANHVYLLQRGTLAASGAAEDVLTPEIIQPVYGLSDDRVGFALSGLRDKPYAEERARPMLKAAE